MAEPKYKVGDKVRIQSLEWHQKEIESEKWCPNIFDVYWCSREMTISKIVKSQYLMEEDGQEFSWTDEMIEGLVEEETKPKFKVGDKVILDSYPCVVIAVTWRDSLHGFVYTVRGTNFGKMVGEEDLIFNTSEEEVGLVNNLSSRWNNEFNLPDGYIFKDQTGNEIHTTKIVLEKANTLKIQSDNMETETHRGYYTTEPETTSEGKKRGVVYFWDNDFTDKVELDLSNRELIQEDGKWFVVKKKKGYPKTYDECCEVLSIPSYYKLKYSTYEHDYHEYTTSKKLGLLQDKLNTFGKLLTYLDAYWKIAGDEIGLGKPWEPDWKDGTTHKFIIHTIKDEIRCGVSLVKNHILSFPTEEMRDAFYENFKEEIEICKEFL